MFAHFDQFGARPDALHSSYEVASGRGKCVEATLESCLLLEDPLAGFSRDTEVLFSNRQPILGRPKRPNLAGFDIGPLVIILSF